MHTAAAPTTSTSRSSRSAGRRRPCAFAAVAAATTTEAEAGRQKPLRALPHGARRRGGLEPVAALVEDEQLLQ